MPAAGADVGKWSHLHRAGGNVNYRISPGKRPANLCKSINVLPASTANAIIPSTETHSTIQTKMFHVALLAVGKTESG